MGMVNKYKFTLISKYLLFFTITTTPLETIKLTLPIVGVDIRLYQIGLGLSLIWAFFLAILWIISQVKQKTLTKTILHMFSHEFVANNIYLLLLIAFWLVQVIGGVLYGGDLRSTLIKSVILASLIALFALVYYSIQTRKTYNTVLKLLMEAGLYTCIFAVYQMFAYNYGLPNFMVMEGRANGFMPEPDWLAVFLSLLVAIILPLIYFDYQKLIGKYVLLIWMSIALMVSISRSGWVAAAFVSVVFFVMLMLNKFQPKVRVLEVFLGYFIVVFIAFGIVKLNDLTPFSLKERALSIVTGNTVHDVFVNENGEEMTIDKKQKEELLGKGKSVSKKSVDDINVVRRVESYREAIEYIQESPLLGIGPAGLEIRTEKGINTSNIFLGILVAGGTMAVTFFLVVIYLICKQSFLVMKYEPAFGYAMLLGTLSLLVSNSFNDGLYLGVLWVILALFARTVDILDIQTIPINKKGEI
jgi:O-antigen ligase